MQRASAHLEIAGIFDFPLHYLLASVRTVCDSVVLLGAARAVVALMHERVADSKMVPSANPRWAAGFSVDHA